MTHAPHRAHGHGERSGRRPLVLGLLVVVLGTVLGTVLALLVPGVAAAEGESVSGTLQTSRSGPIEGVTITVETDAGAAVDATRTDEDGRFTVPVPGPGRYLVTVDADQLPGGVVLGGDGDTVAVTVGPGRTQPVPFGLRDGSSDAGGGSIEVVQLLVDGIRFGLLIAVCAVGLSLVFGTTGLVNVAHGELVTIGAVVAWYVNVRAGVPLVPATVIAMVVGAAVGAANELALWRPLRRRGTGPVAALVVSIGLSVLLRHLVRIVFGGFASPYADHQTQRSVDYGAFTMTTRSLASVVIAVVALGLVVFALRRTRTGEAVRAVAADRDLAAAAGIDVDRVVLVVWTAGGALAALGGVLLGLTDQVQWDMGSRLLLLVFAGVVLGGLGSVSGAVVGSVVVGVVVQLSTLVVPVDVEYVAGLLLLLVVLVVRPQGVLAGRARVG